jgi:uncharacterized membrane protein
MITQIPGLYLGAKLGGTAGVATAYAVLQVIYSVFSYFVLIRTLLGPCLRDYVASMWPSLWMSMVMGATVFIMNIFLKESSRQLILMAQTLLGMLVYFVLMFYSQKPLLVEIKDLVLWRKSLEERG